MPEDDPRRWDAVLFDLDGTIMDSAQSVTQSVAAALRAIGAPLPPSERMVDFVGPPLRVGLREIAGLPPQDVERAITAYREIYHGGAMFEATTFHTVPHLLDALQRHGYPLALATSKAVDSARRILEHVRLLENFAVVAGAAPDGTRSTKADVIDDAVRGLADLGYAVDRIVMVGDREHDVAGAARWGIPCVLVTWGYGERKEAHGAYAVVHTVEDLADVLGVDLDD